MRDPLQRTVSHIFASAALLQLQALVSGPGLDKQFLAYQNLTYSDTKQDLNSAALPFPLWSRLTLAFIGGAQAGGRWANLSLGW